MLSEFRVGGFLHKFKRILTAKDLEIIRRLRAVTIRKRNKDVHSEDEIMTLEEVEVLDTFLSGKRTEVYKREPWEEVFVSKVYGEQKIEFYPIVHKFDFVAEGTYLKTYTSWKRKQYREYINFYRELMFDDIQLICKQCPHLEPIERIAMFDPTTSILKMN